MYFADLLDNKHLIVWGVLAGALWAIANTLTVFAIRDVGLAIAFPLWNTNCLVGIFWGWLLFNELRGANARNWLKVLGGTLAILIAALMLAYSSMHGSLIAPAHARRGHPSGSWCQLDVGHHVCPLPQSLSKRHESALLRYRFYRWRVGHDVTARGKSARRNPSAGC